MSTCYQNPTFRIEKIIENKKKNTPKYEEAFSNAIIRNPEMSLESNQMTDVLENVTPIVDSPPPAEGLPIVIPNAPSFKVPANPLLPPEYQEVLTYNDIQYANGFFRTQIGKFVKMECLIGSNNIVDYYGFLIGVGANYVLLQEGGSSNIYSLDFWSIRSMYVYYDQSDIRKIMANMPK